MTTDKGERLGKRLGRIARGIVVTQRRIVALQSEIDEQREVLQLLHQARDDANTAFNREVYGK